MHFMLGLNGPWSLHGCHIAVILLNELFGYNWPIVVELHGLDPEMMLWKHAGMINMNI
jgi:hypothetical protein